MITRRNLGSMTVGAASVLILGNTVSRAQAPTMGYVVSGWYPPLSAIQTGGVSLVSGRIYLRPMLVAGISEVNGSLTMDALGVDLTGASFNGHVQLAIYNNNSTTINRPSTLITKTASISTNTTGILSAAVGTNSKLADSTWYWLALQTDNATATFRSYANTDPTASWVMGSATLANVVSSSLLTGLHVSGTFGTWPNLTSATFTESTVDETPVVVFRVKSVP